MHGQLTAITRPYVGVPQKSRCHAKLQLLRHLQLAVAEMLLEFDRHYLLSLSPSTNQNSRSLTRILSYLHREHDSSPR